jgi:hypothetical protein
MTDGPSEFPLTDRDLHLVELVNRVLDRGAVITGEITISVAGIDLVYLGLQLVIAAAETAKRHDLPLARGTD